RTPPPAPRAAWRSLFRNLSGGIVRTNPACRGVLMLSLHDPLSRRDLLVRAGVLGASLTLPRLLAARSRDPGGPAADACILVFLWGAPSQFETFDPKPDAPDGIRGEFGTVRTRLPGILLGEHIPLLAARNDRFAVIRTCAQSSTHHQSAA